MVLSVKKHLLLSRQANVAADPQKERQQGQRMLHVVETKLSERLQGKKYIQQPIPLNAVVSLLDAKTLKQLLQKNLKHILICFYKV